MDDLTQRCHVPQDGGCSLCREERAHFHWWSETKERQAQSPSPSFVTSPGKRHQAAWLDQLFFLAAGFGIRWSEKAPYQHVTLEPLSSHFPPPLCLSR